MHFVHSRVFRYILHDVPVLIIRSHHRRQVVMSRYDPKEGHDIDGMTAFPLV
jgi:hypothetical protein